MRLLALFFLALAAISPAFGANVTSTTGWTCSVNDTDHPDGETFTIDAGSNRIAFLYFAVEQNTDPAPSGISLDGDTPQAIYLTGTTEFLFNAGGSPDQHHFGYYWTEAQMADWEATEVLSLSDSVSTFGFHWCFGVIENTSQTPGTTWTGTDSQETSAALALTSTSSSGDLIWAAAMADGGKSIDAWDTLTEIEEAPDNPTSGTASGNGGDASTAVTFSASDQISGVSLVFVNAASSLSFSSGPAVAAASNGYTISGTLTDLDGTATVYASAWLPAVGAPADCDAVIAASGAVVAASDATWAEDMADSFALTEAGNPPVLDIYVCAEDDSAQTAVTAFPAEVRSADSGQEFSATIPWSSLVATSPWSLKSVTSCDTNSGSAILTNCATDENDWIVVGQRVNISDDFPDTTDIVVLSIPDSTSVEVDQDADTTSSDDSITITQVNEFSVTPVSGDALEADSTNSATDAMTYEADGDVQCDSPCSSTGDFWSFGYDLQDISATSEDGSEWICEACTAYVGGDQPEFDSVISPNPELAPHAIQIGTSESHQSVCSDPDSQSVTYAVRETLPGSGAITYSSAGLLEYDGSAISEDEAGTDYTFDCNDSGNLGAVPYTQTLHLVDTWTFTDVVGEADANDAETAILADAEWLEGHGYTLASACLNDYPMASEGEIVAQVPVASAEAVAYPDITLTQAVVSACGALDNGGVTFETGFLGF